ncbi:ribonuclease III [Maridesulfovibrio hydrothermalis]|uniref:Ribonuclease 3 n=1 Tax=Maridesulfovibrio hydrothermalis AM13 = DSM 14728 TaxID=1121451 RepID=L0RAP7_9BACT|nr:ribonuclease III [Maridesulfovibrio hydrothermalis]CCO23848.1 Ribonuclease 3 [Maridesulfovibrio hydrothermalis AM13 = DSM 14728]
MVEEFSRLQQGIHYRFSQVKHLATALTHSSWANEQAVPVEDNERLEFLGDAVLELCVTEELFKRFKDAHEGQLTKIRSKLVKEKSLAAIALELELNDFLLLGKGEEAQGGRTRSSLLADAMEAVIGAVFLDGGYPEAHSFILRIFDDKWPQTCKIESSKDFKSKLQEVTQAMFKERPTYVLTGTKGPEHEKVFMVRLNLPNGEIFESDGTSLKKAEQTAAARALEHLKSLNETTTQD